MKNNSNILFDKSFRSELLNNPKKAINELNNQYNDIEYKVVVNTKDTVYFVITDIAIDMSDIQAGVKVSTVGSVGSFGSGGTISSFGTTGGTLGTVGSLSTVGSAGSLGSVQLD